MVDILKELKKMVPELPEPASYYRGTPETELFIPENVLLLSRSSKRYPSRKSGNPHHRFLLVMNLEGDGEAILDYVRHKLPVMFCLLIFPYQYHHFSFPENIKWLFITFEKNEYKQLEPIRGKITRINEKMLQYLHMIVKDYFSGNFKKKTAAAQVVMLTSLIIDEIMTSESLNLPEGGNRSKNHETALADEINRYLAMNVSRHISIDELAKKFSYSASRLRTVYKKVMGISIGKHMKEIRMLNAQKLLTGTDMRIGDIAVRCGYESLYSFSRIFKESTGLAPRDYRNKYL